MRSWTAVPDKGDPEQIGRKIKSTLVGGEGAEAYAHLVDKVHPSLCSCCRATLQRIQIGPLDRRSPVG